ncbi:hypothetical protein RAM_29680 [Amycolatopsis mediterranei S699]|uniref:Uncharacterized protein n=1 Tax=Amycolatopsis mediterranei (strain S699) TaxID=713604 RepID=A0A9R0UB43_AMYMS|nr:hypothetical protein RAM_29680 [Amycolatopsis mediterranei S699]
MMTDPMTSEVICSPLNSGRMGMRHFRSCSQSLV